MVKTHLAACGVIKTTPNNHQSHVGWDTSAQDWDTSAVDLENSRKFIIHPAVTKDEYADVIDCITSLDLHSHRLMCHLIKQLS